MKMQGSIGRILVAMFGFAGVLAFASEARAVQYGEIRITSNRTLTDDRYGDVVFAASNITLDCANHQVHISSFTQLNGGVKAAIYADSVSGITIKNCTIVGGFDQSLHIQLSTNVTVDNVTASTQAFFASNTGTKVTNLNMHAQSVGLYVSQEIGGSYSASVRCGGLNAGIQLGSNHNTTLANTTVTGCTNAAGIVTQGDTGLVFNNVHADGNFNGIALVSDTQTQINDSSFSANHNDGLDVTSCTNCSFNRNAARLNGICDANEVTSTGDSWMSNTFGTICGTVPSMH